MVDALHIYTPTIRPQNLPAIRDAFDAQRKETGLEVTWHIVLDMGYEPVPDWSLVPTESWIVHHASILAPRPCPVFGEQVLNPVLFGPDAPKKGWVMLHADDNLPPPGMFRAIEGSIAAGAMVGIMFPQEPRYGFPAGIPANFRTIKPGGVDGAQIVFNIEAAAGLHFPEGGCADGCFMQNLWRCHPFKGWIFLKEPVVLYNALRPEAK